jgi:hypothetical protein
MAGVDRTAVWTRAQVALPPLLAEYGRRALHLGWLASEAAAVMVLLDRDPPFWPDERRSTSTSSRSGVDLPAKA